MCIIIAVCAQTESAEDVHAMMRNCWEMTASQRPSFSELVHWLYRRLRPMMHDSVVASSSSSSNRSVTDHCQASGARFANYCEFM